MDGSPNWSHPLQADPRGAGDIRHGQAVLLLLVDERRKVDEPVAIQLQLPRTRYEHDCLDPELDTRYGGSVVSSRIGLSADATTFSTADNLFSLVKDAHRERPLHCLLIDEAQFLSRDQVHQLGDVADELGIPVLCYGLRTDFQGLLFEGSQHLLAWADNLVEIKTICHCGRKATMVLRLDERGQVVKRGAQIKIGGNETYQAVCRKHFKSGMANRQDNELPFDFSPGQPNQQPH